MSRGAGEGFIVETKLKVWSGCEHKEERKESLQRSCGLEVKWTHDFACVWVTGSITGQAFRKQITSCGLLQRVWTSSISSVNNGKLLNTSIAENITNNQQNGHWSPCLENCLPLILLAPNKFADSSFHVGFINAILSSSSLFPDILHWNTLLGISSLSIAELFLNMMVSPWLPHSQWVVCNFNLRLPFLPIRFTYCPSLHTWILGSQSYICHTIGLYVIMLRHILGHEIVTWMINAFPRQLLLSNVFWCCVC